MNPSDASDTSTLPHRLLELANIQYAARTCHECRLLGGQRVCGDRKQSGTSVAVPPSGFQCRVDKCCTCMEPLHEREVLHEPFGSLTWNVPVDIFIDAIFHKVIIPYLHWGSVVTSGTTVAWNPSLESAPRMIPAGIATYCSQYRCVIDVSADYTVTYHFGPPQRLRSPFPARNPREGFERIVLKDINSLPRGKIVGHEKGQHASYPMIRSQIIDLLFPACTPKIFAYELDSIEGIGEQTAIVTQAAHSSWSLYY